MTHSLIDHQITCEVLPALSSKAAKFCPMNSFLIPSQLEEEKKKSVDAQRRHQEEALATAAAEAARYTEMAAAASARAAAADAVREAVEGAEQEEFKRKAQKLKAGGDVVLHRSFAFVAPLSTVAAVVDVSDTNAAVAAFCIGDAVDAVVLLLASCSSRMHTRLTTFLRATAENW